jgi:hypothetical protein
LIFLLNPEADVSIGFEMRLPWESSKLEAAVEFFEQNYQEQRLRDPFVYRED